MFSDRVFRITFFISLLTHGMLLGRNPGLNILPQLTKKEQQVELIYVKPKEELRSTQKIQNRRREALLKLPQRITADKRIPPPFIDRESIFKANKAITAHDPVFAKPVLIRPDIIAIKKKITLPALDMNNINDSSYISYYQIVREKIKRAAYQNYTRTETGEIYLSFLISSDGYLRDVRFVAEKSSPSPYLKDIATRSIKNASPFPNFPKELDYQTLSFNVVISFEIE